MVEEKNIQNRRFILGQYFTRPEICEHIVSRIDFADAIAIEPSFGSGNFIHALAARNIPTIGIELDRTVYDEALQTRYACVTLYNANFYDFSYETHKRLIFVGNPPYRTPAYSLTTHRDFIARLTRKYQVSGIREEAVFFILHTLDLILQSPTQTGEIHYIVPLSIVKNNSKFFQRFKQLLKEHCEFIGISTIRGTEFENVAQELICLSLRVCPHSPQETVTVDGKSVSLDAFLCLQQRDIIPFQKIFRKTYLGSVPCESLLMSIVGESKEHFRSRLCALIRAEHLDRQSLYEHLQYNGRFHLKLFEKPFSDPAVQAKLDILLSYIANIKEKPDILQAFEDLENYKEINGRNHIHYYFRCPRLKQKKNFVYELNPHPGPSFYFTGNPSHNSSDYFGFCNYDINRNVSPGANRTVPLENLEENLTPFFKRWWRERTEEPFSTIFEYIQYIAKTSWYKRRKASCQRFYFGIPAFFVPRQNRTPTFEIPEITVDIPEDTSIQGELNLTT